MDIEASDSNQAGYTVVARRYRPKAFDQLIGQGHVAQALEKAIALGRVGHAYLFTGARGVGKTSAARIFAKALNAPSDAKGGSASEIAKAIDSGEDMDVIEIDGASNRGIEEIRQLRSNVSVRPSRAAYKIYIIDEVHMLTNQAFNALLKTLEEPPAHVKFIFCTTDPDKIPITVLSRCQRFDFAPVRFEAIQKRLQEITEAEGYSADAAALALLARRAAGSMRDSQSLLEQVMSFSVDRITVDQVHALLGTADEGRLLELATALRDTNPLQALAKVEDAMQAGADPGQLAEQLLNYLRDLMAVGVGGGPELLKLANPAGYLQLQELVDSWGVQTILSAIQILDESLVRMRSSVSATTLLEVALVQICQLEQIQSIPALLEAVQRSLPAGPPRTASPAGEKKNGPLTSSGFGRDAVSPPQTNSGISGNSSLTHARPAPSEPSRFKAPGNAVAAPENPPQAQVAVRAARAAVLKEPARQEHADKAQAPNEPASNEPAPSEPPATSFKSSASALKQWQQAVASIEGMLADFAGMAVAVEPAGSDRWKVVFAAGGHKTVEYCELSERRGELMQALEIAVGRRIQLSFAALPGEQLKAVAATPKSTVRAQKMREVSQDPYVKRLCEVLDGEIMRVDPAQVPPDSSGEGPG